MLLLRTRFLGKVNRKINGLRDLLLNFQEIRWLLEITGSEIFSSEWRFLRFPWYNRDSNSWAGG